MPRGQILSGDFVVSIAVFLIALAFLLPAYDNLSNQLRRDDEKNQLATITTFATDALLKTPGFPANWNTSTVLNLGLSDEGKLNRTKMRFLVGMGYSPVRNLLGLGGYDFNLTFSDLQGYSVMTGVARSPAAYFYVQKHDLLNMITNSGLVWDAYCVSCAPGDARNTYNASKIILFNELLANSTAYKTVLIEEPQLLQSDINIQSLKDFVTSGGTLIFAGSADLLQSGFSVHGFSNAPASGIAANDEILDRSGNVTFSNATWYFTNQTGDTSLKAIVSNQQNVLLGQWDYGLGKIYYFTSVTGVVNNEDLYAVLNVIGRKAELGRQPAVTENIYALTRLLVTDENQPVQLSLLVIK